MHRYTAEFSRDGNGPYRLLRGFGDPLVGRFVKSLSEPESSQRERFLRILSGVKGTEFGQEHKLNNVKSLEDFRAAVPIRDHHGLLPWLKRTAEGHRSVLTQERVSMLLETSGTTGTPKHLPVTKSWAKSVSEAQSLWVMAMVRDCEAITKGKALTVVSAAQHSISPGGIPIGSNTGRMHQSQPWWLRLRYPIPSSVFSLSPPELRQYVLLRFALQSQISSITTANPSTILLLCRRLKEWREELSQDLADGTLRCGPAKYLSQSQRRRLQWWVRKRTPPTDWAPAALWPLAQVNCWMGGPASYFVDLLPNALGGDIPIREVGVTASEGYFAIPLGWDWGGGVLWAEGHVLEFIDADENVRWCWELEYGKQYRMVITTEAGLYRYDLKDVIEVVGFCERMPVIRFVGKAGRYLNSTGEKVTEQQVALAFRDATRQRSVSPVGFTARMIMAEIPYIELLVEGGDGSLASDFDEALKNINLEYRDKRSSFRIGSPTLRRASAGTFLRFREQRAASGAPEGQIKDPIIAINENEWNRVLLADKGI